MARTANTFLNLQKLYEKRSVLDNKIIKTEKKLLAELKKKAEPPKKRGRKPAAK